LAAKISLIIDSGKEKKFKTLEAARPELSQQQLLHQRQRPRQLPEVNYHFKFKNYPLLMN
jgi:hypothetical protein